MPNPTLAPPQQSTASYAEWLQQAFPQRSDQKGYIEALRANDPRFADLSFKDAASVFAEASGDSRFNRFTVGPVNRFFDYVASNFAEAMNEAAPSDWGFESDTTYGEYIGGGLKNVSRAFGAEKSTADAFYEAGKQIPAMAGTLALGAMPGIGLPAMLGQAYGGGLDQAYSQGVTDWRALLVGGINAAALGGTMVMARPLANAAGQKALSWMGGEAAKDLSKMAGSEAVKVFSAGTSSAMRKVAVRTAQESMVQLTGSTMSIASAVGSQLIINPTEFVAHQMWDKNFWIPTLVGETFGAVGGSVLGRVKDPLPPAKEILEKYNAKNAAQDANVQLDTDIDVAVKAGLKDAGKSQLLPENAKVDESTPPAPEAKLTPEQEAELQKKGYITPKKDSPIETPEQKSQMLARLLRGEEGSPDDAVYQAALARHKVEAFKDAAGLNKWIGEYIQTPEYKQRVEAQVNNGVIDPAVKAANGIEAGPRSDAEIVAQHEAVQVTNAQRVTNEMHVLQSAKNVGDNVVPAVAPNYHASRAEVIGTTADHIAAQGTTVPHANVVVEATNVVETAHATKHPLTEERQAAKSRVTEIMLKTQRSSGTHEHYFETSNNGKVFFYNPGTKHTGIFTQIFRDGKPVSKGKSPVVGETPIIKSSTVLLWGKLDDAQLRETLNGFYGVKLTDEEFGHVSNFIRSAYTQALSLPVGASFHDDVIAANPKYAAGMLQLLYRTGIQQALVKANVRLRFAATPKESTVERAKATPFDYFAARNRATFSQVATPEGRVWTITRNPGYANYSDLHEVGHAVRELIRLGAFDEDGTTGKLEAEVSTWLRTAVETGKKSADAASFGVALLKQLQREHIVDPKTAKVTDQAPDPMLGLDKTDEDQRRYYLREDEIFAQTVMGYIGHRSNAWSDLIAKHFPRLHAFFSQIFAPFYKKPDREFNRFSPEFKRGFDILKGVLNADYANDPKMNKRLQKLVSDEALSPRVLESLVHVWYDQPTPEVHTSLEKLVKTWNSQEDAISESEQIGHLQLITHFSQDTHGLSSLDDTGTINMQNAMFTMPWLSSLVRNAHAMMDMARVETKNRQGGTRGMLRDNEAIRNAIENIRKRFPDKAKDLEHYIAGRELLFNHWDRLQAVVDVAAGSKYAVERPKTDLVSQIKQLYAMDAVMRKWAMGQLDYQKGRPMYEPTWVELTKKGSRKPGSEPTEEKSPARRIDRNPNEDKMTAEYAYNTARKWFPQLAIELRKAVGASATPREAILDVNGEFSFGREQGKNRKTKRFTTLEEVQRYINEIVTSERYAKVELSAKLVKSKKAAQVAWHRSVSPDRKVGGKTQNAKLVDPTPVEGSLTKTNESGDYYIIRAKERDAGTFIDYTDELERYNASQLLLEQASETDALNQQNLEAVSDDITNQLAVRGEAPDRRALIHRLEPTVRKELGNQLVRKGYTIFNKLSDVLPSYIRTLSHQLTSGLIDPTRFTDESGTRFVKALNKFKDTMNGQGVLFQKLLDHFAVEDADGNAVTVGNSAKAVSELAAEWVNRLYQFSARDLHWNKAQVELEKNKLRIDRKIIGFVDELVANNLPHDDAHVVRAFFESVANVAGEGSRALIEESARGEAQGKLPYISPDEYNRVVEHGLSPLDDENHAANLGRAMAMGPGHLANPTSVGLSKRVLRKVGFAPFGFVDKVHGWLGQGVLHRAAKNPSFAPLMEAIYGEHVNPAAQSAESLMHHVGAGKIVEMRPGYKEFVLDKSGAYDEKNVKMIQSNTRLAEVVRLIEIVEQIGSGHFDKLAAQKYDANDPVGQRIADIKKLIKTPEEAEAVEEANYRRYGAQKNAVLRETSQAVKNLVLHFAVAIGGNGKFNGNAEMAKDFAMRYQASSPEDRVALLVNELGKDQKQAANITQKFGEAYAALLKHGQELLFRTYYVPMTRFKDWHVRVQFKGLTGSDAKGYYGFDTPEQANEFVAKMRAQGHAVQAPVDFTRAKLLYKPMSGTYEESLSQIVEAKRVMIDVMLATEDVPEATRNEIQGMVADIPIETAISNEAVKINKVAAAKRRFTKGYEEMDMMEQHIQGIRRRAVAMARKETDLMFKLFSTDSKILQNNDLFMKMDREFKPGLRMADSEYQRQIGMTGYVACMLANVSSGIIEVAQGPFTLVPRLLDMNVSLKDAFIMPTKIAREVFQRSTSRLMSKITKGDIAEIWEGDELEFIRDCVAKGRVAQTKHHDISQSNPHKILEHYRTFNNSSTWADRGKHIWSDVFEGLNSFYGFFNRFNAEISLMAVYRTLKKQGGNISTPEAKKELFTRAQMISDMTNGSEQKLGRPELFNSPSQAWRNFGSTFWSLQSFVNAQIANQLLYVRKSFNADGRWSAAETRSARKAITAMLGMQLVAFGSAGLTLFPSAVTMIKAATGYDVEEEMRNFIEQQNGDPASKQFMADFAQYGMLYALGFPADVGTRMSISGVGPISQYEGFDPKQLGGPLVGLTAQAMRDLSKWRSGDMEGSEVALNLLPLGMRRAFRTEMFDDGTVMDGNKKKMFAPTAVERIGMALGFNTNRAKKEMEARSQQKEGIQKDTRFKQTQANAAIAAIRDGRLNEAQQVISKTSQLLGTSYNSFVKYVAEQATSKRLGQNVRQGTGPNAQRAARLFPRVAQPSMVERQTMEDQYTQLLGGRVTSTPNTYLKALAIDTMTQNNPSMTTGAASRAWANPQIRPTIYDMIDPNVAGEAFQRGTVVQPSLDALRLFE